jgi:D-glycero-alpha-D-manno-heptose-7-phosphate kinase
MVNGWKSAEQSLSEKAVSASAPCRIDAGGTWDIRALALPCQGEFPSTVNIALDLRTYVKLLPYEAGLVKISSSGFHQDETARFDSIPFDSRFGLFFAAVSHFGFHGLEIMIESGSPVQAAMGGSSTALVALLRALSHLEKRFEGVERARAEILRLAFVLEDSLSGGFCGMQDHAAAVYGGVNRWFWSYGEGRLFQRDCLLGMESAGLLNERLVVAHSGKRHVSSRTNRKWVTDFLSGRTREGWIEANRIVNGFSASLRQNNWKEAVVFLRKEMDLRRSLTPEAFTPLTESMAARAEDEGGAGRFTGAGAGGAVWALAPDPETALKIRNAWEKLFADQSGAAVLECRIDPSGVKLEL